MKMYIFCSIILFSAHGLSAFGGARLVTDKPATYVEYDFSTLPQVGQGQYKITFTVRSADKDLFLSEPAVFPRQGDSETNCKVMELFLNENRWKAEVVGKTKLRVYGRMWSDQLIPVTGGKVESAELLPNELPKVTFVGQKG